MGGGPGGLAAAGRLRERAGDGLEVTLVTRDGRATHLAGTVPVALGDRPPEDFVADVALDGVRCLAGEVSAVDGAGAIVDGERIDADAVIAAPGLRLDAAAVPDWSRARVAWDPEAAAAAAPATRRRPGRPAAHRRLRAALPLPARAVLARHGARRPPPAQRALHEGLRRVA